MELTAPIVLASSWLRCQGPSLSKRAVPPPRSWMTTGWSTKAAALEACCDGLRRRAVAALGSAVLGTVGLPTLLHRLGGGRRVRLVTFLAGGRGREFIQGSRRDQEEGGGAGPSS